MLNVQWMAPQVLWLWLPLIAICLGLLACYSLTVLEGVRNLWSDRLMLDSFSPRNKIHSLSLWGQWLAFIGFLLVAMAGPNLSTLPQMVAAGAVQVQFLFDVSPSMAAEDYRPFLPAPEEGTIPVPGAQWGTRLDAAKYYINDLLPQLENNEAGIITVEGEGYNFWDITHDLSHAGAFHRMLTRFLHQGAAPGAGADYVSGIKACLDEFDLISGIEKGLGDKSDKIRFIVFFTDGGFTGDSAELDKILDLLAKNNVRLLMVAMGGNSPVTVPKYDSDSERRNGQFFKGTTALDDTVLKHMRDKVPGSEIIYATPGKDHISYSFPQKAGGLYARPTQSSLRPWLLMIDILLFLSITSGGGGLPRPKLLNPLGQLKSLRSRAARLFLATRPHDRSNLKDTDNV